VVQKDPEPFRSPKLLVEYLVRSIPGILAVEQHAHYEEARAERQLSLGELDFALVRALGRANLAWVGNEAIKSTMRACDSEVTRTLVKRNAVLVVIRKVLVCLGDVGLEVIEE
jgi:hypothetical protein